MTISENHRLSNPLPQRIVILRALQLGDLLCGVPAFRALRAALPSAEITLVGLPWASEFVNQYHLYLDNFIEFPGYPGLPEREPLLEEIPDFLNHIQNHKFDLALQMQGAGLISNSLAVMFGASQTAGFYLSGNFCPNPETFIKYPVHVHEIQRHLRLMEFLGIAAQGEDLEFPISRKDWDEVKQLQVRYRLNPGRYICLHAGSRSATHRWPIEKFAFICEYLEARGWKVVLTGDDGEREIVESIQQQVSVPLISVCGETSLGGIAGLIADARLLVCNDTGVSHIAAAVRTPSVVIFTDSDPDRWAPLNHKLHRAITWGKQATVEAVIVEVEDLLGKVRLIAA